MCFGGNPERQQQQQQNAPAVVDPAPQSVPQQVASQEQTRQDTVKASNAGIDSAFAQFDDPYYANFENSYKDFYNPQIDNQFKDAQGTLEAGLARNGTDRSSILATQFGRLYGQYADEKAQIGDQAASAANDLRSKVANEKSNLYALNSSSADPAQANTQALAAATSLVAPPTYTPLGNVFAGALAPYAQFANSYSNNAGTGYSSPYSKNSGSGSVVN